MTSMDLRDDHTKTKKIKLNHSTTRGCQIDINQSQLGTRII